MGRGDGAMAQWSIANIVNEIEAMKVDSMEAAEKPTRQPKASKAANAPRAVPLNSTASQEEPQVHEFSEGRPFFTHKVGGLATLTKEGLEKQEAFHRAKAGEIAKMIPKWDKDDMKKAQTTFLQKDADAATKARHAKWQRNKKEAARRKLLPDEIKNEEDPERKALLKKELAALQQRAAENKAAYEANRGKRNRKTTPQPPALVTTIEAASDPKTPMITEQAKRESTTTPPGGLITTPNPGGLITNPGG